MKAIYKTTGKANEYCELAANIYDGCTNGCTYCYAPDVTRSDRDEFYGTAIPRDGIAEKVREQMASGAYGGETIQLCFTCDPYPTGCDTSATREVMRAIKDGGAHVQVLTKNPLALLARDIDLIDDGDKIGTTVTGAGRDMEPNSDTEAERLVALRKIKEKTGCEAWVSCEPVFDTETIYRLLEEEDWIDTFKIGKTNYVDCNVDWAEFGHRAEEISTKFNRHTLIKKGLRKEMETASSMTVG